MSQQQQNPPEFSSFADWCLHKDSLSKEARHTVDAMLEWAGTSDINQANQILSSSNHLNLSDNQISDITPLQSLTNLTILNLSDNQISDITPLQSLTNLKELIFHKNQISDITPLQSLTNLTDLYLGSNQISDITPLQSLTNLISLFLNYNQISDIKPLQSLANLTYLYLYTNQISDITPLQSLTNLTKLILGGNQISDITPLQSLTNLTSLNLSDNQISNLTPLQSLTNLTSLSLNHNQISDIIPLQSLTNLTALILHKNQISDTTPLQSLINLTRLMLHKNPISDITPLQSLTNLNSLILDFTSQQQTLIEALRHSWEFLANSSEFINRRQAATAVKYAYQALDLEAPEIFFCSSPNAVFAQLPMLKHSLKETKLGERLEKQVKDALRPFSLTALPPELSELIIWYEQLEQQFKANFSDYHNYSKSIVNPKCLFHAVAVAELYVSASGIALTPEAQKALESIKQILAECDWIFAFEKVCYVCSRPTKLSLDIEHRLHAEGEAALEFNDGYKLYSYHGVTLPEKYGQIHPNQWEATWILEEENAELRRVLIQGIGYARICQELQAIELDTWQEYTLLRIESDIDGFEPEEKEPIYLLKMTCPSTGFIHALRVPPDMQSAREAIRWVNWDVDYEEFSVQT
ncbi:leucine-rich repeat domain-containing protein [Microcoleus sp. CAWBG58]|uniref:leucine-rich repeat domain-containing protein n=1 Tax=Microcoleus sp. CAWBG58 TaxID=2841651 RepID=UPI0025F533DF|nr:leucine-rich repeat domain-containing protein [Microcoleus sp. CAWBG58]